MDGGHNGSNNAGFSVQLSRARKKMANRLVLPFIIIGLVPIGAILSVFTFVTFTQLRHDAIDKQRAVAAVVSGRVDDYVNKKTDVIATALRLYTLNPASVDHELLDLIAEHSDLKKIAVLTNDGQERSAQSTGLGQVSVAKIDPDDNTLDSLRSGSKLFVANRDDNNDVQLVIGLPITGQQKASKSQNIGGIVGYFGTNDFSDVLSLGDKSNPAYAYVVDQTGNLVAYPNSIFLTNNIQETDTAAVNQFQGGNYATQQTKSETGDDVISTPVATKSGWGVIVEESATNFYAPSEQFLGLVILVTTISFAFVVFASLFFATRFVRPIKRLSEGARHIAEGHLDQKIDLTTNDELQAITDTLNGIGVYVSKLIGSKQTNDSTMQFEQTKLSNIINSVSDGVIAVTRSGQIVSVNLPAAKMLGQMPMQAQGQQLDVLFRLTRDNNPLDFNFRDPGIYSYSDMVYTRGDTKAYVDLMIAVLESHDDDVGAIITIHDQTASRELNFMKLDFVAIAAHELRTPLTVIAGYLDMLKNNSSELSHANQENLSLAIVGTGQLRELINKLLNIARIERGDMEIYIEKIDIAEIVKRNVDQHQTVATEKQQTLTYTANTENVTYVPADTASIVEVLNNLIGNALKYTPKGGRIQVSLTVGLENIRVDVIDSGPGIPDNLRNELFTKFYRAERKLITGTRGTGLGLFISKTIIELQHGMIGIEPDKGNGSIFYFTLPIYTAERDDPLVAKNISGGIHGWFKKRPTR